MAIASESELWESNFLITSAFIIRDAILLLKGIHENRK